MPSKQSQSQTPARPTANPKTPHTPTERAPLLLAYTPSPPNQRLYGTSRAVSPKSSPTFWPEIVTNPKPRERLWARWTRGAGILAGYEWPFVHSRRRDWIGGVDLAASKDDDSDRIQRWRENIPPDALVVPLFLITFSCAMADAATIVAYQTFATSMTGNTVLLAISVFGLSHKPPIYAAASLLSFIGAGLVFGQMGGVIGHRRRYCVLGSLTFQIVMLVLAAWTASPYGWPELQPGGRADWVYLLLIGLQGGPQVTLATNAGVRELPTAMMTTPYAAFISDPSLFSLRSSAKDRSDIIPRNRRLIYIILFWAGAFAGGALLKWSSIWILTLAVAGIKVVAAGLIWVSKGSESNDDTDSEGSSGGDEEEGIDEEAVANTPMESSIVSIDREAYKARKRTSSVFEALSRQKPRDEHTVAM